MNLNKFLNEGEEFDIEGNLVKSENEEGVVYSDGAFTVRKAGDFYRFLYRSDDGWSFKSIPIADFKGKFEDVIKKHCLRVLRKSNTRINGSLQRIEREKRYIEREQDNIKKEKSWLKAHGEIG